MRFERIKPKRHSVMIVLDPDEADWLVSAMYEAKSYAIDCGEVTTDHEKFIDNLENIIELDPGP